jgi:hypothetical protein
MEGMNVKNGKRSQKGRLIVCYINVQNGPDCLIVIYNICMYFLTAVSTHLPASAIIPKANPMLSIEFDKCRLISPSKMCNELQKVT